MPTKLRTLAMTTCLGLASIQSASAVTLFKDYVHGAPIGKFTGATGFYDCSNPEQQGRCRDNVDFLGEKFTAVLVFREDRLDQVALVAPYRQDLYPKVSDALAKSFNIISLENQASSLDMVTLRNKATQDEYVQKFMAFESAALAQGDLTYTYLEVPETVGYQDAQALLAASPEDVRLAAVRVFKDNESANLVVRFELPNVNLQHLKDEPDEAF